MPAKKETQAPEKPSSVAAAIAYTIANTGAVPMTGFNRHHNYKFATVEDVLSAVRQPMAEAGLSFYPVDYEMVGETRAGSMTRKEYRFHFKLVHVSGESQDIAVCGVGLDGQDKHYPKALTMAIKNFAIALFVLPRGGLDPDSTEGNYSSEKTKTASRRKRSTRAKAPKPAAPEKPSWNAFDDPRFVELSKKMGHETQTELADLIAIKGWPHPRGWNEERLLNFLGAMERGELEL
jgi:hypothetical protein